MSTHLLLVEPDAPSALLFSENMSSFMDARVTIAHSDLDALALVEAGVQPDVMLIVWGGGDLRGADLVSSLRAHLPNMPIILVFDEGSELPPDILASLNVQGGLTKPFFFPGVTGMVKEVLDRAPDPESSDALAEASLDGPHSLAHMLDEPIGGPVLGEHVELSDQLTERLDLEINKIGQRMGETPLLLSQDGVLISHEGGVSRDSAIAMARLAGRVWREGATRPAREWMRFSDQIPSEGGERRSVALYSVVVTGDLTLTVAWDGNMSLSMLRARTLEAARALETLLV